MATAVAHQLASAQRFFLPNPKARLLAADPSGGNDPQGMGNVPTMFQPQGNTTGSVMQFNGQLPDTVSADERKAFAQLREYLVNRIRK